MTTTRTMFNLNDEHKRYIFIFSVVCFATLKAIVQLQNINLRVANYAVSSPLNYIWLHINPNMGAQDWPAGAEDFRFSFPMRCILWVVENFGVSPEAVLWPFGFLQIFLLSCSIAFLIHTIFDSKRLTLICVAVLSISPIAGVNFGNFGAGIGNQSPVLFYSLANALKFFALAFFLRNSYLISAILLLLACYTHVTLGGFMALFILGGSIAYGRTALRKITIMFAGIGVCLLPLANSLLGDSTITTGTIDINDWLLMSKLFNWHWMTWSHGMFGPLAQFIALPFLVLFLGFLLYANAQQFKFSLQQKFLIYGAITTFFAGLLGLFFSEYYPIPTIMKLAPQRATELTSLIMMVFFLRYLHEQFETGSVLKTILAGWQLILLAFSSFGAALLLPICLYLLDDANKTNLRRVVASSLLFAISMLALYELYLACNASTCSATAASVGDTFVNQLWTPLQHLSPLEKNNYLIFGGGFPYSSQMLAALAALLLIITMRFIRPKNALGNTVLISIFLLASLGAAHVREFRWHSTKGELASAYLDVQRWARHNTEEEAVFIGDPSKATGWREFSARAYFGSISELAHFATLYDSKPERFNAGLDRLRAFNVDPLTVDKAKVDAFRGKYGISVLGPKIRDAYYAANIDELKSVAQQFDVDYAIFEKTLVREKLRAPLVYENNFYLVFRLH